MDTEVETPAASEADSAKSGKRRRKLGPARARAKAETRQALLDAAERLFIQEGFDQPGLDVICSVAGRTRGAYNVHFGSREQLVAAVALRALESFEAELLAKGLSLAAAGGREAFPPALVLQPPATDLDGAAGTVSEGQRLPMPLILHAAARIPNVREAVLTSFARVRRHLGEVAARRGSDKDAGELRFDAAPATLAPMLLATAVGLELLESAGPGRLDLSRREVNERLSPLLQPR